jgi:serine/threonine protein phosphatase PrpC
VLSENDVYMVIASDGLWDVVSESELTTALGSNSLEIVNELLSRAQKNGSRDNISILAVMF